MGGTPIRVVCVDDHPVVRAGLRAMIDIQPHLHVVGEAECAESARAAVAGLDPDMIVMDVRLGRTDGIELTADLIRERPSLKVVILSSYAGDEEVHRAIDAGAKGYVLKEFAAAEILEALDHARKGLPYVSADIARRLARHGPRVVLTPREATLLCDLACGQPDSSIAEKLGLSEPELAAAVKRLMAKFQCATRARLIAAGLVRGFITEDSIASSLEPATDEAPTHAPRGGLAKWQLKRATNYMIEHIEDDFGLDEVAACVNLSTFHFARAFKQMTGLPPGAWLTALRMDKAQELMRTCPEMGLTEVALSVGYQSQAAFGTAFKRYCGASPGEWRRGLIDG